MEGELRCKRRLIISEDTVDIEVTIVACGMIKDPNLGFFPSELRHISAGRAEVLA
ncbi:MAG: hypothetical protein ACON5H_01060 [Akkermansiaceae bacterium]